MGRAPASVAAQEAAAGIRHRFTHSSRMLDFQGAQIELCMDQGEVRTGPRSLPICELELELKSGEPKRLFELALAILEIVPFELETVSKAEQGYRLLSGYERHPVKGAAPDIARSDTLRMCWENRSGPVCSIFRTTCRVRWGMAQRQARMPNICTRCASHYADCAWCCG